MRPATLFAALVLNVTTVAGASVQPPLVAGTFYSSKPEVLRQMVQAYLDAAPTPDLGKQKVLGAVVPHASHLYSGAVAAHAYRQVAALKPKTIVILGISHYVLLEGAAVVTADAYATPLGDIPIDTKLAKSIFRSSPLFQRDSGLITQEHSIEVQLPFLQVALAGRPFKVVPIYVAAGDVQQQEDMVAALLPIVRSENILVLASSDWSHDHSHAIRSFADLDPCTSL